MNKTRKTVMLGLLTAIIILMAFTPLGYLKIGPLSITFLTIPVVVGAVVLGPGAGAVLGGVFGVTSLLQCFGMDWFGTTLFGINPLFTVLLCLVPRILTGFLSGLIFKGISKVDKKGIGACAVASFSGAALNTIGFTALLVLFFASGLFPASRVFFDTMISNNVLSEASALSVISILITLNALVEAGVCLIAGTAICYAITTMLNRHSKKKV